MNFIMFVIISLISIPFAHAQDTIEFWNGKKLPGRITVVNDASVVFIREGKDKEIQVPRKKIKQVILPTASVGLSDKRVRKNAFKFHPVSPYFNHVGLSYERMGIKCSWETDIGYINSHLNKNYFNNRIPYLPQYNLVPSPLLDQGGYLSSGIRFYPFKGLKRRQQRARGFFISVSVIGGYQRQQRYVARYFHFEGYPSYKVSSADLWICGSIIKNGFKCYIGEKFLLEANAGIGTGVQFEKKNYSPPYEAAYDGYPIYTPWYGFRISTNLLYTASLSLGYIF